MFEKLVALARTNALAASLILGTILMLGISSTYLLPEFQEQNKEDQTTNKDSKENQRTDVPVISTQPSTQPKELTIDIQGAVHNPGVYTLPSTARISDALNAAGDVSSQADTNWIARNLNRATKLNDGDKLYIPKKGEIKEPTILVQNPSTQNTVQATAPVAAVLGLTSQPTPENKESQGSSNQSPSKASTSEKSSTPNTGKISINIATQAELDRLNGIGEKRAQDIIKGRPYTKLEELYEKKIIYKSVYEKIKDQIQL